MINTIEDNIHSLHEISAQIKEIIQKSEPSSIDLSQLRETTDRFRLLVLSDYLSSKITEKTFNECNSLFYAAKLFLELYSV